MEFYYSQWHRKIYSPIIDSLLFHSIKYNREKHDNLQQKSLIIIKVYYPWNATQETFSIYSPTPNFLYL